MSRTLTLQLTEEDFEAVKQAASVKGTTPEEWATRTLLEHVPSSSTNGQQVSFETLAPELQEAAQRMAARYGGAPEQHAAEWLASTSPRPQPQLTENVRNDEWARLERHLGSQDLGHATGIDNEGIDADLMREYADEHRDEP